jgi:hypothetical protein
MPDDITIELLKALTLVITAALAVVGLAIDPRKDGKLTTEGSVVAIGLVASLAVSLTLQAVSRRAELQRAQRAAADYRRLLDSTASRYATDRGTFRVFFALDRDVIAKEGYVNRLDAAIARRKLGCTTVSESRRPQEGVPPVGLYQCGDYRYDDRLEEEIYFAPSSSLMPLVTKEPLTRALLMGIGYGIDVYEYPYDTSSDPYRRVSFTVARFPEQTMFQYDGSRLYVTIEGDIRQVLLDAGIRSVLDFEASRIRANPYFNKGPCYDYGIEDCDKIMNVGLTRIDFLTIALRFPHHHNIEISSADHRVNEQKLNGVTVYDVDLPSHIDEAREEW